MDETSDEGGLSIGCRLWIIWPGGARLGPGRVALLEAIGTHGSLKRAAEALGLSYRAAWNRIERLNALAERPLVAAAVGGAQGGRSHLTPAGAAAVRAYRAVEAETRALHARIATETTVREAPNA